MSEYNEGFFPAGKLQPIFFRSWTPKQPKLTLLCVHGTGGNSADYTVLGEHLSADEDVRVVAFDSPANGHTQVTPGTNPLAVQQTVIEKFVDTVQDSPVALMASSGGAIATYLALYAKRQNPRFSKIPLLLAEPSVGFDAVTHQYLHDCKVFFNRQFASLDLARKAWSQSPMKTMLFDDESSRSRFIRGRLHLRGNALVPVAPAISPDSIKPFDVMKGKKPLSNPTLLLWGEHGGVRERFGESVEQAFSQLTTVVLPGAGHPLSLCRPPEIDAIVQFLRPHVQT